MPCHRRTRFCPIFPGIGREYRAKERHASAAAGIQKYAYVLPGQRELHAGSSLCRCAPFIGGALVTPYRVRPRSPRLVGTLGLPQPEILPETRGLHRVQISRSVFLSCTLGLPSAGAASEMVGSMVNLLSITRPPSAAAGVVPEWCLMCRILA